MVRSDVVVTVPKHHWVAWIEEGDLPGDSATGEEWGFFLGGDPPAEFSRLIGRRCYIVSHGRLRGYAPITAVERTDRGWVIGRQGGAVACTITEPISGFRGFRWRWWERSAEVPFPEWRTMGVVARTRWEAEWLMRLKEGR